MITELLRNRLFEFNACRSAEMHGGVVQIFGIKINN